MREYLDKLLLQKRDIQLKIKGVREKEEQYKTKIERYEYYKQIESYRIELKQIQKKIEFIYNLIAEKDYRGGV